MEHELPKLSAMAYGSSTSQVFPGAEAIALQRHFMIPQEHRIAATAIPRPSPQQQQPIKEPMKMADTPRRLVQVFIADPDVNVPLEKALLYSGQQQMTDLSDQELFFEIDMAGILKKHNEMRISLVDKSIKEKVVNLEPVRIRDLRMTVVTIASFFNLSR